MENQIEETKENVELSYETRKLQAAELYSRDELGLLSGVEHVFNEDGSVNWREMVPKEYLFPNKDLFARRNKPIPSSIDGLKDYELCIKLGGIRHLAKLRGIRKCFFEHPRLDEEYVVSQCTIEWMPNYESNFEPSSYSDSANATSKNCRDFGLKFLETIANNRSFIRAVRNYLNVNIVGEDELDKTDGSSSSEAETPNNNSAYSPNATFVNKMKTLGIKKLYQIRGILKLAKERGIIDIDDAEINSVANLSDISNEDLVLILPSFDELAKEVLCQSD